MKKICKKCGKEYKAKYTYRNYCSRACAGAARITLPTCKFCGKVIIKDAEHSWKSYKQRKYCNKECEMSKRHGEIPPVIPKIVQTREEIKMEYSQAHIDCALILDRMLAQITKGQVHMLKFDPMIKEQRDMKDREDIEKVLAGKYTKIG